MGPGSSGSPDESGKTSAANCSALEQCVAAVDAIECGAWPEELPGTYGVPAGEPACRNIIQGKLAPSALCSSTYQCNNGFCIAPDNQPATCFALVADGQA